MSGAPTAIRDWLNLLIAAGHAVLLGLPSKPFEFDLANLVIMKCITVHGIAGLKLLETWYENLVLNFCSNNYLGLANDGRLKHAEQNAILQFGVSPAAVRSIAGTLSLHLEIEKRLAQFKGVEATISFQSGFNSNGAVLPALV